MAMFRLTDFIMYGSFNNITGVSWEVSDDIDFNNIIDSTYNNPDTLTWYSKLVKSDGTLYTEKDILYARCKVHMSLYGFDYSSGWFTKTINLPEDKTIYLQDRDKIVGELLLKVDGTTEHIW